MTNTKTVLAIEQLCAAQALDFRTPLRPGIGPAIALREIRKVIVHAERDRLFGEDIQASLDLLCTNRVVEAVEREIGPLE